MTSSNNSTFIFGIIILIVIVVNIGLVAKLKQNTQNRENRTMQTFLDTARTPWKKENTALDELANLVEKVKDDKNNETGEII